MVVRLLRNLWQEEEGQDLVEYGLLLSFLSLSAVGILNGIGTNVAALWHGILNGLTVATTAAS